MTQPTLPPPGFDELSADEKLEYIAYRSLMRRLDVSSAAELEIFEAALC